MSVDSQALERRTLEQKDRAELAAIVEAMGAKAGSRAKKADLVDQVLRLAGVVESPETPTEPPNPMSDAGVTGDEPPVTVDDTDPPVAEGVEADATGDNSTTDADTSTDADDSTDDDAEPVPASASVVTPPRPIQDEPRPPTGGGAPSRPVPGEGDQGDGSGGDGEGGNRRRRRRGRNRDANSPAGTDPQGPNQPPNGGPQPGANHGGGNPQSGSQQSGNQQFGNQQSGNQQSGNQQSGNQQSGNQQGGERSENGGGPAGGPDAEPVPVAGYLDLRDEGYGFLRVKGYLPAKEDVYVSVKQARQFGLRKGDHLTGASRMASRNEKNPALLRIDQVNGGDPEAARRRRRFEDLTPLFPDSRLRMERADAPADDMTARIVDIIAPIGKGQRALVVSPPKAGKTMVMKQIARSIERNHPDVHLIVLLVDERPEEVTDFRKWLIAGEVAASTFDRPAEEHTAVAELTIERAKRMVEDGRDVCIILDGITRLTRAYNLAAPPTGKIMSGGIDAGALYPPKRFFGAARNIEEGGSLTIIASALVETNSRMDEHIFEELKGTGNAELRLDRRVAERRVYPAIDVDASSTRHEELLLPRDQLPQVWKLRRVLSGLSRDAGSGAPGLELLLDRMRTFKTNAEFLAEIGRTTAG